MGIFFSSPYTKNYDVKNDHYYGYLPEHSNINDKTLQIKQDDILQIKKQVDLSEHFPEVYNQLQLNSSTSNAITSVIEYLMKIHDIKNYTPSKLYIYYIGREKSQIMNDVGAGIRNTLIQINKHGLMKESDYPSNNIDYFNIEPNFKKSIPFNISFEKVNCDLDSFKVCLSVFKKPIIFGYAIYDSFYDKMKWTNDGVMPIPKENETLLGLQTNVCVGYSDKRKSFLIRNSWGKDWKNDGYFFMPFSYFLSKHCDGYWTISIKEHNLEHQQQINSSNKKKKKKKKKIPAPIEISLNDESKKNYAIRKE